jgi:hypothetical protein
LFVSLESLVHCLLESLGFQRQGSLLGKKKGDCLFFSGVGIFQFLSCLT